MLDFLFGVDNSARRPFGCQLQGARYVLDAVRMKASAEVKAWIVDESAGVPPC